MARDRILLCTDFRESSLEARRRAVEYAKALGARLIVFHVVQSSGYACPTFPESVSAQVSEIYRTIDECIREELDRITNQCRQELHDVTSFLRSGVPAEEIAHFAATHDVRLIVMGTHAWSGVRRILLGSTALNVARTASCPVVVVRTSPEPTRRSPLIPTEHPLRPETEVPGMATQRILFCTDFSENSLPARDKAVEYAKAFAASLAVVHIVDSWAGFPAYEFRVPIDVREVVANLEASVKEDLEKLADELRREVPNVTTYCRVGVPAHEIVNVADEAAMDLIVMGTHGWTGFKHFLLGSAAENVLRTANCPVLIVRSPAPEPKTS